MDEFDLFNLVHKRNNQQYLKSSSIHETTMYTLFRLPINKDIIKIISINQIKTGHCNY